MTIRVTATCAWCQVTVETNVKTPIPSGWVPAKVIAPDLAALVLASPSLINVSVEENFCSKTCADGYTKVEASCHKAAAIDYTAKFYSTMNECRAAAKKS